MDPAELRVEVADSPGPDRIRHAGLRLPPGARVRDALQATGWYDGGELAALEGRVGVWGRPQALDHALRDRDRVEVYRPLTVDPKEARRLRQRRQKT